MIESDIAIVGAGSSGCVLAAHLSADPRTSVLLIEAGRDYDERTMPDVVRADYGRAALDSPFNWSYPGRLTARQEPSRISRGKLVGGSSAINGSMFVRGLPEDYDRWGFSDWSNAEMTRVFDELIAAPADDLSRSSAVRVTLTPPSAWLPFQAAFHRAALAAGFARKDDIGDPRGSGVGAVPLDSVEGIRMPASVTHLAPARVRGNLRVLAEAQALKVVLDKRRAVGVVVRLSGGEIETVRAKDVILCASGIGSAQLLMLSGVGPADELRHLGIEPVLNREGVGRNFKDHPLAVIQSEPDPAHMPQARDPRFQVLLQYTSPGCVDRNDMQIVPTSVAPADGDPMTVVPVDRAAWWVVVSSQVHRGGGVVSLRSADPLEKPWVEFNYLEHPDDRARLREGVRLAARLLADRAFDGIIVRRIEPGDAVLQDDDALDQWLFARLASAQHTSGTCRMGDAGDPLAVVDERCRVHGINGLRVVDLSIAPDVVRAPTNATALAIAVRAAELIHEDRVALAGSQAQ
jgi:choline dehydrogenase-like flavoprotein